MSGERTLRVDYDYQIFSMQQFGGISRYIHEVACRVGRAEGFSAKIIAPLHINGYLSTGGVCVRGVAIPNIRQASGILKVFNAIGSRLAYTCSAPPDVLHETYYRAYRVAPRGCPTVLTVHDMIHEKFPGTFHKNDPTSSAKRAAIARARHVICVSHSTRRDLLSMVDIAPEKTSVIHHGFTSRTPTEYPIALAISRPFILYVGDRSAYKNFAGLLRAYAASPRLRSNLCLLAFGGGAFHADEEDLITRLGLDDSLVRQVRGDDAVLTSLYRQAVMFVSPSLYEGFGIPLLEAMSFDCPVICGNTSSIPEVVGDAALMCDSGDVDALRSSMESVAASVDVRSALITRGRERVQHFSWDRCASQTMQIYRRIAQ
ncbi:MAG: hypothetical protein JWQ07_5591 [Ramlibacter sp.]|nr:hypothetical protein [Ramlibacter sp.]